MSVDKDEIKTNEDDSIKTSDFCTVIINTKSQRFSVEILQSIPYFKTFLSERWKKQDCLEEKNSGMKCDIGINMTFSMFDFKQLLSIQKASQIDSMYPFERLQCLLECDAYFCSNLIDTTMVVDYLKYVFIVYVIP